MSILLPEVRDGWCDWTRRFEDDIPWMYLDVRGLVTTGLGCLLVDDAAAVGLPWAHSDGTPATDAMVRAEWWAVKAMPPGLTAAHYRVPGCLTLLQDAIDALALQRLEANAVAVAAQLPELAGWPAEVQRLCMSHAWALGAEWPKTWPHLVAALRAGNWSAAADECRISEVGNPGVRARNDAVQALLRGLVAA